MSQVIQPVELPSFLIDDKVFFNRIGFFLLIKVSFMFQSKSLSFVMYAKNVKTDPQKRSISIKRELYQLKTPVSIKRDLYQSQENNNSSSRGWAALVVFFWVPLVFFDWYRSLLVDTGLFWSLQVSYVGLFWHVWRTLASCRGINTVLSCCCRSLLIDVNLFWFIQVSFDLYQSLLVCWSILWVSLDFVWRA